MSKAIVALCLCAASLAFSGAKAAVLSAAITDRDGHPASDTVVTLVPSGATASHAPERVVIDQRRETFLPLVVVVRKGGRVIFTNNDITKHQVYSFSPIKQFQFVISQGETSSPVEFDQAGIAAIGCNIHDRMIAYVYVAEEPYAAVSDASGHAEFAGVSEGTYRVQRWHPQMHSVAPVPAGAAEIKGPTARFTGSLPVSVDTPGRMKPMHMDY
jgi:plastocyanin